MGTRRRTTRDLLVLSPSIEVLVVVVRDSTRLVSDSSVLGVAGSVFGVASALFVVGKHPHDLVVNHLRFYFLSFLVRSLFVDS